MTFLKLIAGSILTLVLLTALAILIVPRIIDPNDYRDNITSLVKDKTGRDLKLTGDLSISVFPWLGIRTQGLSLSQPAEIDGDMLAVQTAQLRVRLLPLLSKQLEIDTVILEAPTVRLITLKNGINSFSGLANDDGAGDQSGDAGKAVALVIQGLEISDGSLLWDDQQSGDRYQVDKLNLSTGNLIGEQLAALNASGVLIDASAPQPTDFRVEGTARIDTQTLQLLGRDLQLELQRDTQSLTLIIADLEVDQGQQARIGKTSMTATMALLATDGASQPVKVSGLMDKIVYDFTSGQLKVASIQADIDARLIDQPPLVLKAAIPTLEFDSKSGGISAINPGIQGTYGDRPLKLAAARLEANLESLVVSVESLKLDSADLSAAIPRLSYNGKSGAIAALNLDAAGNFSGRLLKLSAANLVANLEAQTAAADSLQLDSADLSATVNKLRITQFIDSPTAEGLLRLQPFNAATLLKDFEIDYQSADAKVLQSVGIASQFNVGTDKLKLTDMLLSLDQSKLTGSFQAQDFANLNVDFELVLDQINLDRYLPASAQKSGDAPSGAMALAVPMALLKDIRANGSFKADQLISGGLELNAIDVKIASTPGNLTITPKAELYQGKLGGSMVFSETGGESQLRIKNNVDLINLETFLGAADVSDQLSGIGSISLDILVVEKNGVQTNRGTINLNANNGALKGVNVKKIVDQTYDQYNQLRGKEVAQTGEGVAVDETRFTDLLGTFKLQNNKISNQDLQINAPLFRVSGSGDIDLNNTQIDYLVNLSIVASESGEDGAAWQKLSGLTIPVRFRGPLSAPGYSLDMKALYQGLAKKEIESKKDEYLQKKLGIEGGGKLSTGELLQQVLTKKLNEKAAKNADGTASESGQESDNYYPGHGPAGSSASPAPGVSTPGAAAPGAAAPGAAATDVYADPSAAAAQTESDAAQSADYSKKVEPGQDPTAQQDGAIPDINADPNAEEEPVEREPTAKELRDERKRRLLESIFN